MQNKGSCVARITNAAADSQHTLTHTHTISAQQSEQLSKRHKRKLDYLHESEFDESRQKRQWLLIYGRSSQIFVLVTSKSTHNWPSSELISGCVHCFKLLSRSLSPPRSPSRFRSLTDWIQIRVQSVPSGMANNIDLACDSGGHTPFAISNRRHENLHRQMLIIVVNDANLLELLMQCKSLSGSFKSKHLRNANQMETFEMIRSQVNK